MVLKPAKIGLLGGIGPIATAELYIRIIRKLQQKGLRSNKDYPQIIINSINAPELVGKITADKLEPYKQGLLELDSLNPDVIIMACNTVHLFYDELRVTKSKIVDLRDEVHKRLGALKIKRVAVLGTRSAVNELYRYDGIYYARLEEREIDKLEKAITQINLGKAGREAQKIAEKYSKGYNILLACTELATAVKVPNSVDTLDVMAESAIKQCQT